MSRCQRDRWRAVVWRTRKIPNSVRLLLLLLTEPEVEGHRGMDRRGYVSIPRSALAKALGVSPQRVTERFQTAHEARLLDTVRRGRPGVTAEYAAVMPNADSPHVRTKRHGPETRTPIGPDVRTTNRGPHGPHVQLATVVGNRPRSDVAETATSAPRKPTAETASHLGDSTSAEDSGRAS